MRKEKRAVFTNRHGGYVHARDGDNRKAGWFEVIVGKSLPEESGTAIARSHEANTNLGENVIKIR
jgi:hypothetical protein